MSLKICFVVGDRETLHCGVKDYTYRLAEALRDQGLVAEVVAPANWSLRAVLDLGQKLRPEGFDIVHVQYPSVGVRGSLLPHCLGFARIAPITCVTVHEYISKGFVQKACTQLFRLSTDAIVFTTAAERLAFEKQLKAWGPPHLTQGIGSNVPALLRSADTEPVVIYFGQIRAGKGLEAFLALAQLSGERGRAYRFHVLGASLPRQAEYINDVRATAPTPVQWLIGRPLDEIAQRMSKATAAYLPYPDGAGFRRGSLLASLVNGLPVITRTSEITPQELAQVILHAQDAEQALVHLDTLSASKELSRLVGEAGRLLTQQFSWPRIAEVHKMLYEKLLHPGLSSNSTSFSKNTQSEPR